MSTIQVKNVTMRFKDVTALNNVSLTFEENKIYGLLGRNGAGKTTLLNLISNRIFPNDGSIQIDDENVCENDKALQKTYCMSENALYPPTIKIKEILHWSKEFYPNFDMEYAHKLSDKFSLNLNKQVKSLSTGYSSIFKIVIALSCNTPIILLDEPVLGLDANHRDMFYKELIDNYSKNPRTIVISTHLIEEIADIIEQVVIIKNGEIILDKPSEEVFALGYAVSGKASDVNAFIVGKKVLSVDVLGGLKTAYLSGERKDQNIPDNLEVSSLDLQKLFIKLTND